MLFEPLLIIAAYLLGSVSTAIIACRAMGAVDPRSVGSGNPGATNVLRAGGKRAAFVTLAGDVLKGLLPVALAQLLAAGEALVAATALAAFCGHVFPIYYGFKGGKGVATALGVVLGMQPWAGLGGFCTWLIMVYLFRYSSLAALAAALLTPGYMLWLTDSAWLTGVTMLMSVIILWRHRSNFRQLLNGTEDRIGTSTPR